jgi:ketosteroid isomerase-like protein
MRVILAAAFLMCFMTTVAFGQETKSNDLDFKALIDRYCSAWSSLDPNNAAPLYAKDADLVFYDIAPLKYSGWAEYDQGVRKVLGGFETLKLTPNSDLKVTRRGNIAWTTVTHHLSAKLKGGGPMESDVRQTAIWEKRSGKWLIVHEHFSAPLPG